MTRKQAQKKKLPTEKETIKSLHEIEEAIRQLSQLVFELKDKFEFPTMIAEIQGIKEKKKVKNITSSLIMRRYKIGSGRTARLMDQLMDEYIIN